MNDLDLVRRVAKKTGAAPMPSGTHLIELGEGAHFAVKRIPYHLNVPYACHDRTMASIKRVYPSALILDERRIGYLGAKEPVRYSLLCFKPLASAQRLLVVGAVADQREAWSYRAELRETAAGGSRLLLVLEEIAALPITLFSSTIDQNCILNSAPTTCKVMSL